jgi:hypothetical protein
VPPLVEPLMPVPAVPAPPEAVVPPVVAPPVTMPPLAPPEADVAPPLAVTPLLPPAIGSGSVVPVSEQAAMSGTAKAALNTETDTVRLMDMPLDLKRHELGEAVTFVHGLAKSGAVLEEFSAIPAVR